MGRGKGAGTGFPIYFHCPKFRALYYKTRTRADLERHTVELTGRTRPTPRGNGNSRKSWTTYEYRCACGHVGWSCHKDLERMAAKQFG